MINRTRITKGAAVAYTAWVRRAAGASPGRAGAGRREDIGVVRRDDLLLDGQTAGGLPPGRGRDPGRRGPVRADLRDLAGLAAEIYTRSLPEDPGKDQDQAFEDRSVKLETTLEGAGVLSGDLTPECASIVTTVLEALSAPAGAEDTRSQAQRYHDALHEAHAAAGHRRAAAGAGRAAGQSLGAYLPRRPPPARRQLRAPEEWTESVRAAWAAHRAEASAGGSDGGAWLDGDAAQAMACDAAMAPFVTGEVNPAALEDLVRLCVELDRLGHHPHMGSTDGTDGTSDGQGAPAPDTTQAWEALEQAIIGKAVDLLSGPGGLASFLRRRQLGARLGGPSLPLDIGYSETIPAGIRNAVILRDKHCQWAGRCNQPATACQVHHVKHKANGGKTSVRDCVLLCWFHHQVVIHRWGWTPGPEPGRDHHRLEQGQTKVLHSHGPPVRPG